MTSGGDGPEAAAEASRARRAAIAASLVAGCSGDPASSDAPAADAGSPIVCVAGETPVEGGCRPAGVAPEMCGVGFEPDGAEGCRPILPPAPCAPGQIAVPGDATCREIASCGAGKWGEVPLEPSTQFVDVAYPNADSDGTEARPWTTIDDGVVAAQPGAVVALAAGTYDSPQLSLAGKAVRIWGRCPSMVEIVGTDPDLPAVRLSGSAPIEIHQVAITGSLAVVSTAADVLLDRVWIHDSQTGVTLERLQGECRAVLRDSLVEAVGIGVICSGATLDLSRTAVRDTIPSSTDKTVGTGVWLSYSANGALSTATIGGSLVERTHGNGIRVVAADATLEATVVRDVFPAFDDTYGRGVEAIPRSADGAGSTLVLRSSLVETTRQVGVIVDASSATIESSVIRNSLGTPDGTQGMGVQVQMTPQSVEPATLLMTSCLVEQNHAHGLVVIGAEALVESTVIRDTLPRASDQRIGAGVVVQDSSESGDGSGVPGALTLRASVLDRNHTMGVAASNSNLVVDATLVRDSAPEVATGLYGDGILVVRVPTTTVTASVVGSRVMGSARAGVSNFGGEVSIGASTFECNGVDLDGEELFAPAVFDDQGGNSCGCNGSTSACQVVSTNIDPPTFGD